MLLIKGQTLGIFQSQGLHCLQCLICPSREATVRTATDWELHGGYLLSTPFNLSWINMELSLGIQGDIIGEHDLESMTSIP